jgi:NTE family protein
VSWALVLSGGGTSGLAWETGLLKGLLDRGADLTTPDLFVGTSAGAILAAQLATGQSFADIRASQCQPDTTAPRDPRSYFTNEDAWPATPLLIPAIDKADGSLVVWNKAAGVPLLQALASSCATPIVAGAFSGTNTQLAFGHRLVIVVAVARASALGPLGDELGDEIAQLRAGGSRVELITPDAASVTVLFPNLLAPARRAASAAAGHAQGRAFAPVVRDWLASVDRLVPRLDADDLAVRFNALTLRKAEWTHLSHLAVGAWHVHRYGADDALQRLREGIRRLNESHGGHNTATADYHETITAAYVRLLAEFLATCPDDMPLPQRVERLMGSPLVERGLLLRVFSRDRLMSEAARAWWIEPDLAPLGLRSVLPSDAASMETQQ